MEIWVNPACSKCRSATEAFDEAGVAYTVRRYLDEPPTRAELEDALARLGLEPWHITRVGEPEAVAVNGLARTEEARGEWVQALIDHPSADPATDHHRRRRHRCGRPRPRIAG